MSTINLSTYVSLVSSALEAYSYATLTYAQTYFDTRLGTAAWDDASTTDRGKALVMATRHINALRFVGYPTTEAEDAGNQFPRGTDTEVPEAIKQACCEEALALLDGETSQEARANGRITSERMSGVSITYDPSHVLEHTQSGIVSYNAWRLLVPYLYDSRSMRFDRV